jgi:hypothetical protein
MRLRAGKYSARRCKQIRLEASGLVTVTHVGKQKHYQAESIQPRVQRGARAVPGHAPPRHTGIGPRIGTSSSRCFRMRSASARGVTTACQMPRLPQSRRVRDDP